LAVYQHRSVTGWMQLSWVYFRLHQYVMLWSVTPCRSIEACHLPDDRISRIRRNVGARLPDYTALRRARQCGITGTCSVGNRHLKRLCLQTDQTKKACRKFWREVGKRHGEKADMLKAEEEYYV